jgi:UDP-N-acetylglucosamine acyltransferase
MSTTIHNTAIIAPTAELDEGVTVRAHAVIKENVRIGAKTTVMEGAVIEENTTLGRNNFVGHYAVLGGLPQHTGYKPCVSHLDIGDGNTFREYVTIHKGLNEGDRTKIGNNCFMMATAHAAHDVIMGDGVIVANGALLAGHVEVGNNSFVSGNVAIHQFARIGQMVMIGGLARVRKDVPPFCVIEGDGWARGLNIVGIRRAKKTTDVLKQLKRAYKIVFESDLNTSQAREQMHSDDTLTCDEVRDFIKFIDDSKQGIVTSFRRTHIG